MMELFYAPAELSSGMTALSEVVTFITGQFTTVITTIISEPLLLLPVGIFGVGAIVGLCKRLIHG